MSPRELIILLLGLAIVGVVLRGLYVAMRARRGQIRLAIDKNIPRDIPLDMDSSELPSGGARVLHRDGERRNDAGGTIRNPRFDIDRAQARAAAMDLEDDRDRIPVLMDAVTVNEPLREENSAEAAVELDFEESSDDERDSDEILLDYDVRVRSQDEDPMAAVRPDYEGSRDRADESANDAVDDDEDWNDDELTTPALGTGEAEDDDFGYRDEERAGDTAAQPLDEEKPDEEEQSPGSRRFEESLDTFSLSAGERIGFERDGQRPKHVSQGGLFDEEDAESVAGRSADQAWVQDAKTGSAKKKRSLFSSFGIGKARGAASEPEPIPLAEPEETGLDPQLLEPQVPAATAEQTARPRTRGKASSVGLKTEMPAPQPTDVLVLNVMARSGRVFAGHDLLETLVTAGLKFGDMQIFHKRLRGDSKGPVVFSVANVLNPGTFDLNAMDDFTTVGVSLFLGLPAPMKSQEAFTLMLDTANHIKTQLDGELRDDSRNIMTAQTVEHYRERIREIELRQLKAAGARG